MKKLNEKTITEAKPFFTQLLHNMEMVMVMIKNQPDILSVGRFISFLEEESAFQVIKDIKEFLTGLEYNYLVDDSFWGETKIVVSLKEDFSALDFEGTPIEYLAFCEYDEDAFAKLCDIKSTDSEVLYKGSYIKKI